MTLTGADIVIVNPTVWLSTSGRRVLARAEQADRARRIPKVLRRPNLASASYNPFPCRCCGARFAGLFEFYSHVIRCRPTERQIFDLSLQAMRETRRLATAPVLVRIYPHGIGVRIVGRRHGVVIKWVEARLLSEAIWKWRTSKPLALRT